MFIFRVALFVMLLIVITAVPSAEAAGENSSTVLSTVANNETLATPESDHSGGRLAYGISMSLGIVLYIMAGGSMAYFTVQNQVKAANKPTKFQ